MIRGSADYREILRETMIHLTTKPLAADGKNMIQRAIDLGAAEMLTAILNTDGVYRVRQNITSHEVNYYFLSNRVEF